MLRTSLALLLVVCCACSNAVAGVYTSPWDGSTISSFGVPNTATYGQTFVADASHSVLNDYTFWLGQGFFGTLYMKGQVYQWQGGLLGAQGGQATGPALFTSNTMVESIGIAFQPVTVNTGNLVLTPGTQYVMLLTVSDPVDYIRSTGSVSMARNLTNQSATNGGGGFVFYNNGGNIGLLNSSQWDNFSNFGDLAFTANFNRNNNVVPEPASLAVFAGLTGVGCVLRRRNGKRSK